MWYCLREDYEITYIVTKIFQIYIDRKRKMRRTDEFYEEEEKCHKLNLLIAGVAVVALLLTGAAFASKTGIRADDGADIRTAEAYTESMDAGIHDAGINDAGMLQE